MDIRKTFALYARLFLKDMHMKSGAIAAVLFFITCDAHADRSAPVFQCSGEEIKDSGIPYNRVPKQQIFDSKVDEVGRIPPRFVHHRTDENGRPLKDHLENDLFEPVYIVVDPSKWLIDSFRIGEQPRHSQLRKDTDSVISAIKSALVKGAKGQVSALAEISELRDPVLFCIEYDPTLEESTVTVKRKKAPARDDEAVPYAFGPLRRGFIPLAVTLNKVKNEKYDPATQQIVSNRQHSLLAGLGAKIGDFETKYPTDEEPGYWKNISVSALLRPRIGSRTWGGGFALSYPVGWGADIFVGGLWTKGDGQGAHTAGSLNAGIMVPVSVALGSSN